MDLVVLVHGYNKSRRDMYPLQSLLRRLGYETVLVSLPLRFRTLAHCVRVFEKRIAEMSELRRADNIYMVGHSMGGLVIRHFLARNTIENLARCVFIAPPNQGTKLVDIAETYIRPWIHIFKPLQALRTRVARQPVPVPLGETEIGVIAGSKNNLWLGIFLASPNDGRVEVEATRLASMADFLVMPYGHKEIHHRADVAAQVDYFLRNGAFQRDE